jgi:hypothetical protein
LSFTFILKNTTDSDFRLSDSRDYSILVSLREEKALSSNHAVKFTRSPIFVPAKQRAQVGLRLSCYECKGDIGGFVLFDETSHYEINFNLAPDWEKE